MKKPKNSKYLLSFSRIFLGSVFLLMGTNEYFHLFSRPDLNAEGIKFLEALRETGYLLAVVNTLEVICGTLLVTGVFVPVANIMIFPILINIVLFHLFIAPRGLPLALGMMVCSGYIFWCYRYLFGLFFNYNLKIDLRLGVVSDRKSVSV